MSGLRLTRFPPDKKTVGFFRFRRLGDDYLLTNDVGAYSFLCPADFELFLTGKTSHLSPQKYDELRAKGFVRDWLDMADLAKQYARKNAFLACSPGLHIVVVTLRCDHRCVYCQTSPGGVAAASCDMDRATARRVVDTVFLSPSAKLHIEFQGGEPLLNFDAIKFIVAYALRKNVEAKRDLRFSLVTNLTFMNKAALRFLMSNDVGICTSLDGPAFVHDKMRLSRLPGGSHGHVVRWIRKIQKEIQRNGAYRGRLNALTTVTRHSLPHARRIVDEFMGLGLDGIHLRPVSPFGIRASVWRSLNPGVDGFMGFYREALEYIIDRNRQGVLFFERMARIFLTKILTQSDPNFLDLRSPCGAGIGQVAYNFNGDVYTCDEGRMFSRRGDESFRMGTAGRHAFKDLIDQPVVKAVCMASLLDNLPGCSDCAYLPYCGVCPAFNYATEGDFFSRGFNERCRINMAVLDLLFSKLSAPAGDAQDVLATWVSK